MTGTAHDTRPVDGRRERWQAHRARRRATLVQAGVHAVDRYGPDASAEEIAATARVSRTVLYRYFRDKDDLRQAVAARVVETALAELVPPLHQGRTANEIIRGTVGALTRWVDEHPKLYLFLRQHGASGQRPVEDVEATMAEQLAGLLGLFMAGLGLSTRLAEPGAHSIVGMVENTVAWWVTRRSMSRDELVDELCNSIWYVIDGTLRANGIALDPDAELPREAS